MNEVKQGTWHRRCYQDATHSGMLMRAKEKYEKVLAGPNEFKMKGYKFARSKTHQPTHSINKAVCFCCDGEGCNREKLREVRTMNEGASLRKAIELSRNDKLCVKFSTAINATNDHAIDKKYQKMAGLKMFQMYSASLWHHIHQLFRFGR